jgi:cell wall-associated NlpC family hydrolase
VKGAVAALAVGIAGLLALFGGVGVLAGVGVAVDTSAPSVVALAEIPPELLAVYGAAAATCPGLPWPVLAAVGWVESRHGDGHVDPATGDVRPPIIGPALDGRDGRALVTDATSPDGYAHAEGPMQFLPGTWSTWATLAPRRPPGATPDAQNAWDAVYGAARMLCGGHQQLADVRAALFAYNHSNAYVDAVLAKAATYAGDATSGGSNLANPAPGATFAGDGRAVVAYALTQLGVPYVWGGTTPGVALDCSGLVLVSYRAVGIALPRTTFEQATVGVTVALADLQPGDLLFFHGGQPPHDLGHVTIYVGNGQMISAPHTGAVVTVEPAPLAEAQLARRVLTGP